MSIATAARAVFALAVAASLSGCMLFDTSATRAVRNNPNFKAGYSDGCASANNRGTNFRGAQVRDDALFQTSPPYRAGWGEGYSMCNNQLDRNRNTAVGDMPDQRPNP